MEIEEAMLLISIDTNRAIVHPFHKIWERLDTLIEESTYNFEWADERLWAYARSKIPRKDTADAYRTLREFMIKHQPDLEKIGQED
jgi:hypothetical protein